MEGGTGGDNDRFDTLSGGNGLDTADFSDRNNSSPYLIIDLDGSGDDGGTNANPENDNVDVHVVLGDGRTYGFLVATPNNIFWCMENEGLDYFFGTPAVFVKRLTRELVEEALTALAGDSRWLDVYGVLQRPEDPI